MKGLTTAAAVVAALAFGWPAAAMDEETSPLVEPGASAGAEIGRIEFMAGCAQCHGVDGRGDGVIADYLTVEVPDLTTIQRDNEGVFPAGLLYEIIEGRDGIAAHGTRTMPAWGDRYSAQAYMLLGWPHDPGERDAFIRGRILALVEHVASLQVE
jgi:mono/diheme cytochrome c family protein